MIKTLAIMTAAVLALGTVNATAGCGDCGGHKGEGKHKHAGDCKGDTCEVNQQRAREKETHDQGKHEFPTIDTAALKVLLATNDDLVLLDARSGKYDDGQRLPGAGQMSPNSQTKEMKKAIPAKDSLIVTYCSNVKCPASLHLARALKKHGYTNVIKYPAGIEGWMAAGNQVEKAGD